MTIIKNSLGWEDEFGMQLAYDEEHSFMNVGRPKDHQRPIWKDTQTCSSKSQKEKSNES